MNGNAHPIAPLDASLLKITHVETLKPVPTPGTYGFGDIKTDYMLVMEYTAGSGWSAPEIKPYGPLALDPASNCLQYCTNVFEGMKAFIGPDGKARMFRADQNMTRLVSSAERMGLPTFDPDALLKCITALVSIERRWIPAENGHSLYIRPTMIGTKASIRVGKSDSALLYTLVTPVGPYFPISPAIPHPTLAGVSLLAISEHVRSWPGGTGGYKLGLNYSPGFVPQTLAAQEGYDQVLWCLDVGKKPEEGAVISEAGAMNFFAVLANEGSDGGITIVTPPLDGTILPGITRDSALQLLRAHADSLSTSSTSPFSSPLHSGSGPISVIERPLSLSELAQAAQAGRLLECFGTGTAVLVVAIERIGYYPLSKTTAVPIDSEHTENTPKITDIVMKGGLKGLGQVGKALYEKLGALKDGSEEWNGWNVVCE
ncbi:Branched-chain-amino-acid aminotransferase [Mycena indigotica]|uniref:Branched-chain-amino-acid aminotransferase n=1 Tax=Mycena indigotica TaxID=2126181 RepID=A0A8H6TE28_9AGAR|nr:Branched-chain-amino-acid aminotransferase [Mycena indigotica]KAF7315765.1 Branched-chain-amino-acid aminotransferase [Mycena indigotica]